MFCCQITTFHCRLGCSILQLHRESRVSILGFLQWLPCPFGLIVSRGQRRQRVCPPLFFGLVILGVAVVYSSVCPPHFLSLFLFACARPFWEGILAQS